MTDYKDIKGQLIQTLAADPSNPPNGQVWYNSTSNTLKGFKNILAAWATGNNVNNARSQGMGAGSQTAALFSAGQNGVYPAPFSNHTELYNGTNWTEVNNLNTARRLTAGCGASNTAALAFGGYDGGNNSETETWNGTNWTEVNNMNEAKRQITNSGTNTAALTCQWRSSRWSYC